MTLREAGMGHEARRLARKTYVDSVMELAMQDPSGFVLAEETRDDLATIRTTLQHRLPNPLGRELSLRGMARQVIDVWSMFANPVHKDEIQMIAQIAMLEAQYPPTAPPEV